MHMSPRLAIEGDILESCSDVVMHVGRIYWYDVHSMGWMGGGGGGEGGSSQLFRKNRGRTAATTSLAWVTRYRSVMLEHIGYSDDAPGGWKFLDGFYV